MPIQTAEEKLLQLATFWKDKPIKKHHKLAELILLKDIRTIIEYFKANPADIKKTFPPFQATPIHYLALTWKIADKQFQKFIEENEAFREQLNIAIKMLDKHKQSIAHYAAFGGVCAALEWVKRTYPASLRFQVEIEYLPVGILSYAVWSGNPAAMQWVADYSKCFSTMSSLLGRSFGGYELRSSTWLVRQAIYSRNRAALHWVMDNFHKRVIWHAPGYAIECGSLTMLKYVYRIFKEMRRSVSHSDIDTAVKYGQLHILKWFKEQKEWAPLFLTSSDKTVGRKNIAYIAAERGHLPILQWIKTQKDLAPLLKATDDKPSSLKGVGVLAATHSHFHILKWMRDKAGLSILGTTWIRIGSFAIEKNRKDILLWLFRNLKRRHFNKIGISISKYGKPLHIGNLAHYVAYHKDLMTLKMINISPAFSPWLGEKDSLGANIAHIAAYSYPFDPSLLEWIRTHERLSHLLTEKDADGRSIIHYIQSVDGFLWIKSKCPSLSKDTTDKHGYNLAHAIVQLGDLFDDKGRARLELKEYLPLFHKVTPDGHNIAHLCAAHARGDRSLQSLYSIKELAHLFTQTDKYGYNIAHFSVLSPYSVLGKSLRVPYTHSDALKKLDVIAKKKTLSSLIKKSGNDGCNLAHVAAYVGNLDVLKWIRGFAERQYKPSSKKEILMLLEQKTRNGTNIAHLAARGGRIKILGLIRDPDRGLNYLLIRKNLDGFNVAHFAAEGDKPDVLDWISKQDGRRVYLDIRDQLTASDRRGRNIAHIAALNDCFNVLDWIIKAKHHVLFNVKDKAKKLPFDIAIEKSAVKSIQFFLTHAKLLKLTSAQIKAARAALSAAKAKPTRKKPSLGLTALMPATFLSQTRARGKDEVDSTGTLISMGIISGKSKKTKKDTPLPPAAPSSSSDDSEEDAPPPARRPPR